MPVAAQLFEMDPHVAESGFLSQLPLGGVEQIFAWQHESSW